MGKSHNINRRKFLGFIGCSCGGYFLNSCGTVPITERKQLTIYPESVINRQAAKAYDNLKSNFMFHEDLVNLLPKLLNKRGIINVGGKSQSIYRFAKKYNKKIKKIRAKKNNKFPLNQTMNISKMRKILFS